jgi:hypothetical protein
MRLLTATRLLLFLLLAAFASIVLIGCGSGTRDEEQQRPTLTLDEANLTVDDVYARFAEVINRPGSVYRATIDVNSDGGYYSMEGTRTLWADVGQDMAREEGDATISSEGESYRDKWRSITVDGGEYRAPHEDAAGASESGSKVRARTCHGANEAVSAVLGCPGWTEKSTTSLEIGEYKGHHAVILVTSGTRHGEDETTTFTERLYLNASTLLPIALEGEGDTDYGEIYHGTWLYKYENEFVSADSLPDDFFDPASIGYVEPDPEAQLNDDGFTVYWLGRDFDGVSGLPSLALSDLGSRIRDPLMLNYRPANDEFGPMILSLNEYSKDAWSKSQEFPPPRGATPVPADNWWEQPCKDIDMSTGHATLVLDLGNETENGQALLASGERACIFKASQGINLNDRFFALVFLDPTVIQIDAPLALDDKGVWNESPYNSLEGMKAAVRALQPRE